MPRRLVVCCDGTANEYGKVNTNVVRVVESLTKDDDEQLVYYDPGVGTMPDPSLITRTGRKISTWLDLAFATSLTRQVSEAYVWLMNNWQKDDRIYIFGFSRGAYTARVVAALLHHIGLLPRGGDNLVPYAIRLLRSPREEEPENLGDSFRNTFSRDTGRPDRRVPIRFLGVWDTVSSVGWFFDPVKYRFTRTNPSVQTVRHAIAIDERRAFYRQNRVVPAPGQDVKQLWFAGVHSDIGGGYNDSTLWKCTFDWMVKEAADAGLSIDETRLAKVSPAVAAPWLQPQHDELRRNRIWWICEIFPKVHWNPAKRKNGLRLNLGRRRTLEEGELLHPSAIRCIRESGTYKPRNLSQDFLDRVKRLPDVPEEPLAYPKAERPASPLPAAALSGATSP